MHKLIAGAVAAGFLGPATLFGSGVASADTALIVPGTAPSPYGPLRATYHFKPEMDPEIGQNFLPNRAAKRQVVQYPESFWPVTGLHSQTVGKSVNVGTSNLNSAIRTTDGPKYVTGLSQGTLALDAEQQRLAHDPTAPPPDQLMFIKAGDPSNLLRALFKPGTHVPVIDYTVQAPVESQYDTTNVIGQYDIFSDPPQHWNNLLADLNAVTAAGYYGHSATAFADPSHVAPGDITTTTSSLGGTETTYLIRSDELPLVKALVDIAGLPPQAAAPLNVVLRPMIDTAYDPGAVPGSSFGPFGQLVQVGHIAPAISIPIESTNAGITAGTTLVSATTRGVGLASSLGRVTAAAKGAGGKGVLAKVALLSRLMK